MRHLSHLSPIGLFAVMLAVPSFAVAQQAVSKSETVTKTMTIRAIDPATRTVTVALENGEVDSFELGPQVTRFNELKVGDKVRMTYFESAVIELRKPGDKPKSSTDTLVGTPGSTKLPSGTVARLQTTTVTVQKVDPAAPSITVQTADGRTVTRKVNDKALLGQVKPGDRLDITYSQAVAASVERVP